VFITAYRVYMHLSCVHVYVQQRVCVLRACVCMCVLLVILGANICACVCVYRLSHLRCADVYSISHSPKVWHHLVCLLPPPSLPSAASYEGLTKSERERDSKRYAGLPIFKSLMNIGDGSESTSRMDIIGMDIDTRTFKPPAYPG